ncbi:ATP-binding cassette domain-containing protein [Clostridium bovifaecis]|uniref:ATP-binding cassette domain-containing protein n=1 Tax=Clostridium bovifaecis TaxID=2184719 RepID=A0A6I6EWS7_9CLOT|nr:ATP-binding cassette domain-containing protein [Clostridium bovifaecis]
MMDVEKNFGSVEVLKNVNLKIKKGEIHALLGENGAGKSTLMNILGGIVTKDKGRIILNEREVEINNPFQAKKLGIGFIHQELNVINDLNIYENMFLGREVTKKGFLYKEAMYKRSKEILESMDIGIDPATEASSLDTSYKQIVEIGRVLLEDARVIIMDEPTSSLTDKDIEKLFSIMKKLKNKGVSIIYISHKLKEVFSICDFYTVLRDGQITGEGLIKDIDEEAITKLMVGRSMADVEFYKVRNLKDEVLRVEDLSYIPSFKNISFSLRKGEILGFTGLTGDGRSELFQCIFGFRKGYSGKVFINGNEKLIGSTSQALKEKIGLVPKDRKENGIVKDMTVKENMSLASLKKLCGKIFINKDKEKELFNVFKKSINIKVESMDNLISNLSGGNQQKVILARWLQAEVDILILDNPTQGIDVCAKSEIYSIIMALAEKGKSIVVLSSEIPELLKVCDRIITMFHGEITGCISRESANEELIMQYSTGIRKEEPSL